MNEAQGPEDMLTKVQRLEFIIGELQDEIAGLQAALTQAAEMAESQVQFNAEAVKLLTELADRIVQ
jgi:hypothetical protein